MSKLQRQGSQLASQRSTVGGETKGLLDPPPAISVGLLAGSANRFNLAMPIQLEGTLVVE